MCSQEVPNQTLAEGQRRAGSSLFEDQQRRVEVQSCTEEKESKAWVKYANQKKRTSLKAQVGIFTN